MKRIYEPKDSPMRIVAAMSGSGTNLERILEHLDILTLQLRRPPFKVVAIHTDNEDEGNNSLKIAQKYDGIPVITNNFNAFCQLRGKSPKDPSVKPEYFATVLEYVRRYEPDLIALAGYMKEVTKPLLGFVPIVNVHPADLSVRDKNGQAIYTGSKAVSKAILAGEKLIRASTHIATAAIDQGSPLLISEPVTVQLINSISLESLRLPENEGLLKSIASQNQDRLKRYGDWRIYPKTIEFIARGLFATDKNGTMHLNGMPIPSGYKLTVGEDINSIIHAPAGQQG